jgi:hypothetical protein
MRQKTAFHENLKRSHEVKKSSDRSFGLVFTAVFLVIGLWPVLDTAPPRWWALGVAAVFLVLAVAYARALAPLNRWWLKLAHVMNRVANPVIMGLLYFGVLTPIGLLRRVFEKDSLNLAKDPSAKSYWIERETPGPLPDSMKQQF